MKQLTFILTLLGSLFSLQAQAYVIETTSTQAIGDGYYYAEVHQFDTSCIGETPYPCFDIKVVVTNASSSTIYCGTLINNMNDSFDWRSSPTGSTTVNANSSEISQSHISITSYDHVAISCSTDSDGNRARPSDNGISLECPCSYSIKSGDVRLQISRIYNNRSGGHSGTLKIKLWATSTPYTGGTINGHILAEYRFSDTLNGGEFYYDIDRTVSYDRPPEGTYFITMTVTEFNGEDIIRDFITYNSPESLGDDGILGAGSLGLWMIPAFGLILLIRRFQ